jgi:hypothetical protein
MAEKQGEHEQVGRGEVEQISLFRTRKDKDLGLMHQVMGKH